METVIEAGDRPERGEILRRGFRIGEWIVKPIEGLIEGHQGSRHLQPKSMDVLLCLASSPNHFVERDELIEHVWGQAAVTDEPLTRCIHEIRRELNDTCGKPTYIQTIPKRGYRLIADVEPAGSELQMSSDAFHANDGDASSSRVNPDISGDRLLAQLIKRRVVWVGAIYAVFAWAVTQLAVYGRSGIVDDLGAPDWLLPVIVTVLFLGFPVAVFLAWAYEVAQSSTPVGHRWRRVFLLLRSRRGIDLVVVTALLAVFAILAMDLRPQASLILSDADSSRLAVLPFSVDRADRTANWLGRGVAQNLANILSRADDLEVAASSSSFRYFPDQADIRNVGRELNVHYVLTGKIDRDRDRLRVSAHLFDSQTGFRLWSEAYDRKPSDLFVIQQDIARQALGSMEPADRAAALPVSVPPTTSVTAYDHYLQARNLLQQSSTLESLDEAAEGFTQAIQYDTGFAAAYAGLCTTLVRQLQYRPMGETVDLATNVCRHGVDLDPDSVDAHTAQGHLYRATGRPHKAIDQYRRVIGQRPRATDAYLGMGAAYLSMGDFDKAERAYRYAIHVKPDHSEAYLEYGQFLFGQGRYREVIEVGRQLIQLNPVSIDGYNALGQASFASGQFDIAIAAFREVIRREPTAGAFANMGAGYYYLGRYQAAIRMYTRALEMGPLEHRVWGELGDAYLQAGDTTGNAARAYARARDLVESARQIAPNDPMMAIHLAYYCAAVNDGACAAEFSATAVALAPATAAIHYYRTLVNLRLGHEDEAVSAAERALALGYPRALFNFDPMLETVRNSPRLVGILFGPGSMARNLRAGSRLSSLGP